MNVPVGGNHLASILFWSKASLGSVETFLFTTILTALQRLLAAQ